MESFGNLKRTNADSGKNGGGNVAIDLNTGRGTKLKIKSRCFSGDKRLRCSVVTDSFQG